MNYNFDIQLFIGNFIPIALRKTKHLLWLFCLFTPFASLKNAFLDFIAITRYEASLTGQTTILQMALNNLFDNISRRIFITNRTREGVFIYNKSESQAPDYVYNQAENHFPRYFVRNRAEASGYNIATFRVNVPAVLGLTEAKIRAYVDKYKIAGVVYEVIFF